MEVILTKDVDAVGGKNEVVRVKDGFARNYLFPKRLAIPASQGNLRSLKDKIRVANDLKTKRIDAARELAERLSKLHLVVVKKAGKEGKLFGSVTAQEIVDKIKETGGIELDKHRIHIPAHLKSIGAHTVPCRLEVGVTAVLHVDVRSDEPVKKPVEAEGEVAREAGGASTQVAETGEVASGSEAQEASGQKRPKRRSDAEVPEDAVSSRKRPKKRREVNEAEAELP